MHILHIDTGREMRGGQRQVLLLIKALTGAGHECSLLTRKNAPLRNYVDAVKVPVGDATLSNVWLLSSKADLVHVHDAHAHTLAAVASRKPFVVSRRVAFPVKTSFVSRWKYSRARRFLAVSRYVAQQLLAGGVPASKIDVAYDAVDGGPIANGWNQNAPAVALATRDPMKGHDLIEIASRKANVDVVFSTDLARDLQHASMFLYISRSEGLGSGVLLAMRMGVPVVASRTGGLTEIFEHGVSGFYVENEPEDIAAAMQRITADPALASRIVCEARNRVASRFTKQHLLDATLQCYTRALAG